MRYGLDLCTPSTSRPLAPVQHRICFYMCNVVLRLTTLSQRFVLCQLPRGLLFVQKPLLGTAGAAHEATPVLCLHQTFVEYDEWADYLKEVAEDASFALYLASYPDLRAVILRRLRGDGAASTEESP